MFLERMFLIVVLIASSSCSVEKHGTVISNDETVKINGSEEALTEEEKIEKYIDIISNAEFKNLAQDLEKSIIVNVKSGDGFYNGLFYMKPDGTSDFIYQGGHMQFQVVSLDFYDGSFEGIFELRDPSSDYYARKRVLVTKEDLIRALNSSYGNIEIDAIADPLN